MNFEKIKSQIKKLATEFNLKFDREYFKTEK